MNIPANSQIHGMTCGGCHHAISNHTITAELSSTRLGGKCKICGCNGVTFD